MGEPGLIRSEPFRLFFPMGMLSGFVGVAHWGWYYSGIIDTYSCNYHGLMQMQGFETAFVVGFMMTAIPRFLDTPFAATWEVGLAAALLIATALLLRFERWEATEVSFILLMTHLSVFWLRRHLARRDDPPALFSLIPVGLVLGLTGGLLILYPPTGFVKLGHRMVEQGMLLCFLMAFGSYLGRRLVEGATTEELEGTAEGSGVIPAIILGVLLLLSFLIESGFHEASGRLLRAATLTIFSFRVFPILRFPGVRGFTAWALWLGFWLVLLGQWLAGLFPDYEIVALHLTFIGGFSLITMIVSTRVIAAHCGPESIWNTKARALKALGLFVFAALISRASSDFMEWYYFGMLHVASGFWMAAALIWGFAYVPRMLRPTPSADVA